MHKTSSTYLPHHRPHRHQQDTNHILPVTAKPSIRLSHLMKWSLSHSILRLPTSSPMLSPNLRFLAGAAPWLQRTIGKPYVTSLTGHHRSGNMNPLISDARGVHARLHHTRPSIAEFVCRRKIRRTLLRRKIVSTLSAGM